MSGYIYPRAYDKFFDRGFNVISVIFWFAGFVVIGRDLPTGCYELLVCRAIYASAAIGVVIWLAFMFLTIRKPTEGSCISDLD